MRAWTQNRHLGENLLHLCQRLNSAGRQHALRAQGAFQGLGQAVGVFTSLRAGQAKSSDQHVKGGVRFEVVENEYSFLLRTA